MSLIVTLLPKQGIKPQNPLRTHQRINILIRRMPIQPRRERGILGEIWVLLGGFDEGVVGEVEEFEAVVACLAGAEDVAFSSGLEVYFGDAGAVEGVGDGGESFLGFGVCGGVYGGGEEAVSLVVAAAYPASELV